MPLSWLIRFYTHDTVFTNKMPCDQILQGAGAKYLLRAWSSSSIYSHLKLSDIQQIANLELNATDYCFLGFLHGYTNRESMVRAADTYNHLSEYATSWQFYHPPVDSLF
jgi:hypothetical protein